LQIPEQQSLDSAHAAGASRQALHWPLLQPRPAQQSPDDAQLCPPVLHAVHTLRAHTALQQSE
jgi:hypothetical protein